MKALEFTPEQLNQIKSLYEQDFGSRKIAKILGMKLYAVKVAIKKAGIDPSTNKYRKRWDQETLDKVTKLYNAGVWYKNIAKQLNIENNQAYHIIDCILKLDVTKVTKQPIHTNIDFIEQVRYLYEDKYYKLGEIAEELDCYKDVINKVLNNLGIKTNKQPNRRKLPGLLPQIKQLYEQGMGYKKIAQNLNVSTKIIKEGYDLLGFTGIPRHQPRKTQFQSSRKCRTCQQDFPLDQFRSRKHDNGLITFESDCRECMKQFKKIKHQEKYQNDPVYKLRGRVSSMIRDALFASGASKAGISCIPHLPWTIDELKQHLESQFEPWMNWSNHGLYRAKFWDDNDVNTWTWQIDHIIPQSTLPYTTMTDPNFYICWDLKNLRPLSAKQNNEDGVNRTRHNI